MQTFLLALPGPALLRSRTSFLDGPKGPCPELALPTSCPSSCSLGSGLIRSLRGVFTRPGFHGRL